MSGPRPDDDPGIYTMPAETFRVGAQASVPAPEQPTERTPEPASAPPAPRRHRKGWDIALTIVLLVLLLATAVVASSFALALGVGSDACGSGGRVCRQDLLAVGVWTAFTTPLLVLALAAFFGVVLLVVRRRAFWVPIAGFVLLAALWALGVFLIWAAT